MIALYFRLGKNFYLISFSLKKERNSNSTRSVCYLYPKRQQRYLQWMLSAKLAKVTQMRIKEEFKRSGAFWLPSTPQNQIHGMLSILDGGNVKLELTQSLDPSIQGQFGYTDLNSLNRILGHVEKDGPVMIDRSYRIEQKHNFAHGGYMVSNVIWAKRVFMSFAHAEDVSPRFNTCSFSIEGIDEWVGITGIEVDHRPEGRALTISYDKPTDISLNLQNGMQLLITFTSTFPGFPIAKRAEVSQKTYFRLISPDPYELDTFISVAQKVTAFLCFVMNEIVCLDRMSVTSDSHRQEIGDGHTVPIPVNIYCSSWPYSNNEPAVNELDILFKYKDIQSRAESMINKWIINYEQIAPALNLYFLTKAGTIPSWNTQFLTLVQALEAFHRRTSDEKHMDENEFKEIRKVLVDKCPKKERSWFADKLNHANELTLRNRLERMTDPFSKFMGRDNKAQLIDKIVKTRNYLTHYSSDLESEAAKGEVLQFLCSKMNALFRLHFLKLIGFDEQEIDEVVDKCPYFKGECNL